MSFSLHCNTAPPTSVLYTLSLHDALPILDHARLGYNYRLDEMSAALGLAQIQRIDDLLAKRAQVAAWYNERIDTIDGIHKPHIRSEEHTSELQSRENLVCRLLLETRKVHV